jgi:hypothetical protein
MTPSLQPSYQPQPNADEVAHEVRATLEARRELGAEYDAHFIRRLAEQLTAQVRQEVARAPRPRSGALSADQRTAVAICSLVFGIPLVAIAGAVAGAFGLVVAFAGLVLINLAAGRAW